MKNVEDCAMQIPNGKVVSQMGIMLITSFNSSTFVTVASFHGFCFSSIASSKIAALSRNLQVSMQKMFSLRQQLQHTHKLEVREGNTDLTPTL